MRRALAAVLAAVTVLLAGCSSGSGFGGVYSLPLPGGPSLGAHPYTVKAEFANVVDLVPHADVRVNDVAVGQVTGMTVPPGSWNAVVTMRINGSVHLPANAIAELTSTSLLGEEYVALAPPPGGGTSGASAGPAGPLADGATIPVARTTANATVEQVLGALSLLLNGGGLAQIHAITTQLNDALSGNEPQIRSALDQIATLVKNLNSHRSDITAALDGLNQLSRTLNTRDAQIGSVLDNLSPGLATLSSERDQLVTMLNALHRLSAVATSTINASETNAVADLRALTPVLNNLANAGKDLPDALQVLFTFPFPVTVAGGIKNSDYLNSFLTITARKGTCVYAPLDPANQAPSSGQGQLTCPPQP